jgi:uncharacterized membrane protein
MSRGRIHLTLTVAANAAAIFDFLTDLSRAPEWDSRVVRVAAKTRGPLRPGSILRSTVEVEGEIAQLDDEITELSPPTRLGLRSVHGATNSVSYELIQDRPGATRLEVDLAYELAIPPNSPLDEIKLRESIAAGLAQSLQRMKDIVERERDIGPGRGPRG